MSDTSHESSPESVGNEERSVGIDTYKQFLSTIRANLGGVQPPMASYTSVGVTFCSHGDYTSKTRKDALKVACDQKDDLITWVDDKGRKWVGLKLSAYEQIPGGFAYGPSDVDALKQINEIEVSRETSDKAVIGWVNRQISEIEGRIPDNEEQHEDDGGSTEEVADKQATDGAESPIEGKEV